MQELIWRKGKEEKLPRNLAFAPILLTYFLNGEGELVSQNYGYMEEGVFLAMAQNIDSPNNKKSSLKERFAKGEKDRDFLINIMKLNSNSDYEFAKQASERYFANRKKTDEFTKEDIGFLLFFLKSTEDANYKTFISQKADIIKYLPEQNYNEFNNQLVLSKVVQESIDDKNKKVNEDYFMKTAEPLVGKETAIGKT